jgi:glycosyltransferase involved in cell wall biosynthesis
VKVGLLGNMNNMLFAFARLLRRSGIEAELLLFDDEFPHFHPSSDSYDLGFMKFTRTLSWGSGRRFLPTARRVIRDDLSTYDILVGCGLAPAYCLKAGRQLDVFVPYGGDILVETMFRLVRPDTIPSVWAAALSQRRGISKARVIHMPYTNDFYERRLQRFSGRADRWLCGVPMVDSLTYDPATLHDSVDRTHWYHEFQQIRAANDLVLISTARHSWGRHALDQHRKGTDALLGGLSLSVRRHPRLRIVLVTLEYGDSVRRSKDLIEKFGITDRVAWFPQMARKDLMVGLSMADIVCGDFEIGWLESGTRYEALVSAKPLLAFRDDAKYAPRYEELYPMMNARSPESVADRIEEYVLNPDEHVAMGRRGRQWYERYVVQAALREYINYIDSSPERTSAMGEAT